jgi:glutamate/aspartate transport system substrate-binding protein
MNDEKLGMNIISAKDHGEAFLTLETGRAVAFMMDDALLYGELAKAKRPADWVITGTPQSFEAYGCMMRKDDPGFKKVVDAAPGQGHDLRRGRGDLQEVVHQPIPPKGLNLNFPCRRHARSSTRRPTRPLSDGGGD